jgi:hypothetical protein
MVKKHWSVTKLSCAEREQTARAVQPPFIGASPPPLLAAPARARYKPPRP